jgi:hypothetical protein
MQTLYPAQILRAFRQAPWRQQTQALAALSIGLMILLVIGGLYLAVASRAGNAGRDLQFFEARKADLSRENDRLRTQLADLRSMTRMANRALELGFIPAQPDQVHYVSVPDYPYPTAAEVEAAPRVEPPEAASPGDWLTRTLNGLLGGG